MNQADGQTYNLTHKGNVLTTNQQHASWVIGEETLDVETLVGILQDQISCHVLADGDWHK
jgi:hypothetical protein